MAFDNFRARQASLLHGFDFTDEEIRTAVRRVKQRNLDPLDKYVVAQLKLARLGELVRASPKDETP